MGAPNIVHSNRRFVNLLSYPLWNVSLVMKVNCQDHERRLVEGLTKVKSLLESETDGGLSGTFLSITFADIMPDKNNFINVYVILGAMGIIGVSQGENIFSEIFGKVTVDVFKLGCKLHKDLYSKLWAGKITFVRGHVFFERRLRDSDAVQCCVVDNIGVNLCPCEPESQNTEYTFVVNGILRKEWGISRNNT